MKIFTEQILKKKIVNKLVFHEVNQKIFPTIKLKEIVNKRPSTPIIINASNEVLVDQFLAKNIAFFDIYKYIMSVLRDKNFKKYAIRIPKNINQILIINNWAKRITLKKIFKS